MKSDITDSEVENPSELEGLESSPCFGDDTKLHSTTDRATSDSGSVVVHDGMRDDGPAMSHGDSSIPHQDDIDTTAQDDASNIPQTASRGTVSISTYIQVGSSDSTTSPNPRKRSAKAASLPDSIAPDDEYNGTRHELAMTKIETPPRAKPSSQATSTPRKASTPSKISKLSKASSFIPISTRRSVSLDKPNTTSEITPVVGNLASDFKTDFLGVEAEPLPMDSKEEMVESVPDENTPPWHSPETPPKAFELSGTEPLTEAKFQQRSYDTESMRVRNGSIPDTEGSYKEQDNPIFSFDSLGSSPNFLSQDSNQLLQTQTDLPHLSSTEHKRHEPRLILSNGILYLQTPPSVYRTTYQIGILLKIRLQKGKSNGWWELVVSGLPRLAQFESGYLYFRTPAGQGMEFVTSSYKRHTLVESCLMAQFDGGKILVAPLRKCSAECYGYLKNYKVNAVVQAEVTETEDPSSYLVNYNAVCSVDLINHNFWAEKCKFYLYVYGGPDGEFDGVLDAEKPLINVLPLDTVPYGRVGLARINITSIPQALGMLMVTWKVDLPRSKAVTWLPWIKGTFNSQDAESVLRQDYALLDVRCHHLPLKHQKIVTLYQTPCSQPKAIRQSEPEYFKPPATENLTSNPLLQEGTCVHDYGSDKDPSADNLAHKSTMTESPVTETPAPCLPGQNVQRNKLEVAGNTMAKVSAPKLMILENPVAESPVPKSTLTKISIAKPTKSHSTGCMLWSLWLLIKFLFGFLALLASVHTIYWSYQLRDCGFRFDPVTLYASCPHKNMCLYNHSMVDAENLIYAKPEIRMDTAMAELDLQPELIQTEIAQSADTTHAKITPVPLRDRIDYFLGWRGPIMRE